MCASGSFQSGKTVTKSQPVSLLLHGSSWLDRHRLLVYIFSHTTIQPQKFPPTTGLHIAVDRDRPIVPDNPIIPYIEGDSTGASICVVAGWIFDMAVTKVHGEKSEIGRSKISAKCDRAEPSNVELRR